MDSLMQGKFPSSFGELVMNIFHFHSQFFSITHDIIMGISCNNCDLLHFMNNVKDMRGIFQAQ